MGQPGQTSGALIYSPANTFNPPRLARGFFFCTRRPDRPYSIWCRINRPIARLIGATPTIGTKLKALPRAALPGGAFFCLI